MPSSTATATKKVVLVTGANSGVGLLARQQRIGEVVAKLKTVAATSSIVEGAIVDLAILASVCRLLRSLTERDLQLYTIVCNAGVQAKDKTLTEDKFDTTVGVNHVAHFLLVKLLQSHPADCSAPRLTTRPLVGNIRSQIYLDAVARGEIPYDMLSVYSTSKLFNLLHIKEFARRFPDGPEIVAYTPGFTSDTGLRRYVPSVVCFFVKQYLCLLNWSAWSPKLGRLPRTSRVRSVVEREWMDTRRLHPRG